MNSLMVKSKINDRNFMKAKVFFLGIAAIMLEGSNAYACEPMAEPPVILARSKHQSQNYCVDIYATIPKKIGDASPFSAKLIGKFEGNYSFLVDLKLHDLTDAGSPDKYGIYFCLSEAALSNTTLDIPYFETGVLNKAPLCMERIVIHNISSALADYK